MKEYAGSRGRPVVPFILNVGVRRRLSVQIHAHSALRPAKRPDNQWIWVWVRPMSTKDGFRKDKIYSSFGIRAPDHPALSQPCQGEKLNYSVWLICCSHLVGNWPLALTLPILTLQHYIFIYYFRLNYFIDYNKYCS